ncbi:hypothetical protein [Neobacillus sp. PS2-9]|uniref:hypothetical protein n=1 Tax=Neobacillus sp. PS2-9 TaxID=3070676 RepID=UPI0027E0B186|nr:hypothetical protein [Neobacillus sp. PS2-9]WML56033.1 hypothetical protein RCG25_13875 [Neobacillus sp. PS2-9]
MLLVQIGAIIVAIFIGYTLARREYIKFTVAEKEQFRKELENPIQVLFHVLHQIGYFIFFIGIVFNNDLLRYIAFFLIGTGWIIDGAKLCNVNRKRGMILIFIGSMAFLTTSFFAIRSFWF